MYEPRDTDCAADATVGRIAKVIALVTFINPEVVWAAGLSDAAANCLADVLNPVVAAITACIRV